MTWSIPDRHLSDCGSGPDQNNNSFDNTGSGLYVKGGGKLQHFAIAGADMKFVWAKARIRGEKVIVTDRKIKNPVAARYAWADNPEGANLYNREGLPPRRSEQIKGSWQEAVGNSENMIARLHDCKLRSVTTKIPIA